MNASTLLMEIGGWIGVACLVGGTICLVGSFICSLLDDLEVPLSEPEEDYPWPL